MSIQFSDLLKLWGTQRCAESPLKLIGVRGALVTKYVKPDGLYDSVVFVLDEKAGSFTSWLASVDPSEALIANPINADGAAQLAPGVHLFRRGIHKENPAWHCLVQAEDFTVYRLTRDGAVHGQESGDFGIHLHSGGTGEETKRFSAGCQIIHNGDGYFQDPTWSRFIKTSVSARMEVYGVEVVPYLLVQAAEAKLDFSNIAFENPVTA